MILGAAIKPKFYHSRDGAWSNSRAATPYFSGYMRFTGFFIWATTTRFQAIPLNLGRPLMRGSNINPDDTWMLSHVKLLWGMQSTLERAVKRYVLLVLPDTKLIVVSNTITQDAMLALNGHNA